MGYAPDPCVIERVSTEIGGKDDDFLGGATPGQFFTEGQVIILFCFLF